MTLHRTGEKEMPRSVSTRMCVACRSEEDAAHLLRVIRDMEGSLVPDWNRKLGGRGAHVCLNPKCISQSIDRHLFDRPLRSELKYPEKEAFFSLLRAHLQRNLEALLSSALRKGALLAGTDAVLAGIGEQKVCFMLLTPDSSGFSDFCARAAQASIRFHSWGSLERLGNVLGRRPTGVVGITDINLAKALRNLFDQWDSLKLEC